MNLTAKPELERIEKTLAYIADINNDDLLEIGVLLEEELKIILRCLDRVRGEVMRRKPEGASVILGENAMAQVAFTKKYTWDADVLAQLPPMLRAKHLEAVPARVVEATTKVRNTNSLLREMANLGESETAEVIRKAMSVEESAPKVSFLPIVNGED